MFIIFVLCIIIHDRNQICFDIVEDLQTLKFIFLVFSILLFS